MMNCIAASWILHRPSRRRACAVLASARSAGQPLERENGARLWGATAASNQGLAGNASGRLGQARWRCWDRLGRRCAAAQAQSQPEEAQPQPQPQLGERGDVETPSLLQPKPVCAFQRARERAREAERRRATHTLQEPLPLPQPSPSPPSPAPPLPLALFPAASSAACQWCGQRETKRDRARQSTACQWCGGASEGGCCCLCGGRSYLCSVRQDLATTQPPRTRKERRYRGLRGW